MLSAGDPDTDVGSRLLEGPDLQASLLRGSVLPWLHIISIGTVRPRQYWSSSSPEMAMSMTVFVYDVSCTCIV